MGIMVIMIRAYLICSTRVDCSIMFWEESENIRELELFDRTLARNTWIGCFAASLRYSMALK